MLLQLRLVTKNLFQVDTPKKTKQSLLEILMETCTIELSRPIVSFKLCVLERATDVHEFFSLALLSQFYSEFMDFTV